MTSQKNVPKTVRLGKDVTAVLDRHVDTISGVDDLANESDFEGSRKYLLA
jgi:hypothetical protein